MTAAAVLEAPPGVDLSGHVSPGDAVFTLGTSWVNRLVQIGQRLDLRLDGFPPEAIDRWCRWDHVALVVSDTEVVEALPPRIRRSPLSRFTDRTYVVARTGMHPHDAAQAVAFAEACDGLPYAWRHFIGLVVTSLSGGRASYSDTRARNCSAFYAEARMKGDVTGPDGTCQSFYPRPPAAMTPARLAMFHAAGPFMVEG